MPLRRSAAIDGHVRPFELEPIARQSLFDIGPRNFKIEVLVGREDGAAVRANHDAHAFPDGQSEKKAPTRFQHPGDFREGRVEDLGLQML